LSLQENAIELVSVADDANREAIVEMLLSTRVPRKEIFFHRIGMVDFGLGAF
jgi:hypothetical protein